jgi:hypothetical protein
MPKVEKPRPKKKQSGKHEKGLKLRNPYLSQRHPSGIEMQHHSTGQAEKRREYWDTDKHGFIGFENTRFICVDLSQSVSYFSGELCGLERAEASGRETDSSYLS